MEGAKSALRMLERTGDHDTGDEQLDSLTHVPNVIGTFDMAWRFLIELSVALDPDEEEELTEGQVKEILRRHESQISELEHIDIEDDSFQNVDEAISDVRRTISRLTHGVMTYSLPGVNRDCFDDTESVHFSQLLQLFGPGHSRTQFIFPIQNLKRIFDLATILRNILEGRKGVDAIQETLQDIRGIAIQSNLWQNPLHRQVWRLQDLQHGGGLGFTVELFFIVLEYLYISSLPSSNEGQELRSLLYVGTFRIMTSDWSKYKHSLGTQQLLLDMVISESVPGIISRSHRYPTSLVNEFFVLLGNILEGQTGPHIDNVVQELSSNPLFTRDSRRALVVKALGIISPTRTPCSS